VVRRLADGDPWVTGRAGMRYRDLVPGRLGGAVIASHIRIPEAGEVPDLVHFHDVAFQLIFCAHGWVRLVYEDQGPPFVLKAGDCLIQPPRIRHRVLEASAGLEVVELTAPAEHLTTMDHEMELPTATLNPERRFGAQRFHRSEAEQGTWGGWRLPGFEARDTGLREASAGAASVRLVRPKGGGSAGWARHTADVLFGFVWTGSLTFLAEEESARRLSAGDSFVIPPGMNTAFTDVSTDLQLLEVSLPAAFETIEEAAPPL
jgi:quercetin dioxygenase-like cupin family protein